MIENTYKTILFEQFKSDKNNLATYLEGCDNPASEAMLDDLEKLTVHSFDEFVKRFSPKVYQNVKQGENGFIVEYSFEPNGSKPVSIASTPYFKMILNLCQKKGDSKQSNRDFDYRSVLESIMPQKVAEKAKRHRFLLENTLEKYYDAEAKGEDTSEYNDKYCDTLDEIQKIYKDSIQGLLPLAISDRARKIDYIEKNVSLPATEDGTLPQIGTGELIFGSNGDLVVRQITQQSSTIEQLPAPVAGGKTKNEIQLYIADSVREDYEAYIEKGNEDNETKRELVLSSFSPCADMDLGSKSSEEITEVLNNLRAQKTMFENAYKSFVEGFANKMAPLIEKMLAVKLYFDHATIDGKLPEGRGLIVANCTPKELLEAEVKDKFERFMKHFGTRGNGNNKIWLGILPNIKDDTKLPNTANKSSSNDNKRKGPGRDNTQKNTGTVDNRVKLEDAGQLLDILNKSRVLTFFSCKATKENTFAGIDENYIAKQREDFKEKQINGEYSSYAYPNFSVMDLRKMKVEENTMEILEDESANKRALEITLPAIYLDACYVAAGLVAGSQQHEWLLKRGIDRKLIADDLPCVHINFERRELQSKLTTFMNRELTTPWNESIISAINRDNFGFVFGSDYFEVDGKPVNNTYVLFARNMKKGEKSYMPIYTALVKNYVYAELNKSGYKTHKEIKKQFIDKTVNAWDKDKINKSEDCINLMLYSGEEIEWPNENEPMTIKFGKNEIFIDMGSDFIKTEE